MAKNIQKQFLLLPLLLGFIFLSCQDEVVGGMENKVKKVEFNATIERAKEIFDQKSPDFPIIQSRTVDGVEKGIVFEPVWDDSFVTNHTDGTIQWKLMFVCLNLFVCFLRIQTKHTNKQKTVVI